MNLNAFILETLKKCDLHDLADKHERREASLKMNFIRGSRLNRMSIEVGGAVEVLVWEFRDPKRRARQ